MGFTRKKKLDIGIMIEEMAQEIRELLRNVIFSFFNSGGFVASSSTPPILLAPEGGALFPP